MTNLTYGGSPKQIALFERRVLKPLCNLLTAKDETTVMVVLNGIRNIFNSDHEPCRRYLLCMMIEECGGLDKIEQLQTHENEYLCLKSTYIIDQFFGEVSFYLVE